MIEVWTDGSGTSAGRPAGWAYVMVQGGRTTERSGRIIDGTNNMAELTAAIEALAAVRGRGKTITLYTDSTYVAGHIQGHYQVNANHALVQRLRELAARHTVTVVWVRGHAGDKHNERCDQLAGLAREGN